jgi:FkbM family methyltransferase
MTNLKRKMNIVRILRFLMCHPLNRKNKAKALSRFIRWQINSWINPYPIIYQFTEKSVLIIQKGMSGATGNLYGGLYEFEEMAFLLHLLREGDNFVDIGANIGSYSILASAHVGANTISVEPVPSTFLHLTNNININQIQEKVTTYNFALGSQKGNIKFTYSNDTANHVATIEDQDTIEIPVVTLDEILNDRKAPLLLKIDVEGFETEVIKGALNTLQSSDLKSIIIELNGLGARYGYDDLQIHNNLIDLGFRPIKYSPIERKIYLINTHGTQNTIYVRDFEFIQQRIITAPKIKILNFEL